MLNRVKKICRNIINLDADKVFKQVMSNTQLQYDIIQLNTQDQLYDKGITADGKELGGYAKYTLEYKRNIAPKIGRDSRSDHVTLKDTGEFYSTFKIVNEGSNFRITADTEKDDDSLLRYGNILGLTRENKAVVSGWVQPLAVKNIRMAIFK